MGIFGRPFTPHRHYHASIGKDVPCRRCGRMSHLRRWKQLYPSGMIFFYPCPNAFCGYITEKKRDQVRRVVGSDAHRKYLAA